MPPNPATAGLWRGLRETSRTGGRVRVVLLGSIASGKYVDVLGKIFGERLVFPADFVGRGDMSRGDCCCAERAKVGSSNTGRSSEPPVTAPARQSCRGSGEAPPRGHPRPPPLKTTCASYPPGRGPGRGRRSSQSSTSSRRRRHRAALLQPRGPPHQPQEAVLAGARPDEARPPPVLRRRLPCSCPTFGTGPW